MSDPKKTPSWIPMEVPEIAGYGTMSSTELVLLYGLLRQHRFIPMTNAERSEWLGRLGTVERHLIERLDRAGH